MILAKETTALYRNEKLRIGLEEMIYAFDCAIGQSSIMSRVRSRCIR